MFDPLTPNKIWQSAGVGVWYTTSLTATSSGSTRVAWNSQTLGIQQLAAKAVISPPGGDPIVSCMDRQQFTVASPTAQPSDYGISQKDLIVAGWSVDWASALPSTIVALNNWFGPDDSGYSSDGGSTWHLFASPPTGSGRSWSGGQIAASTSTNFCVLPGTGAATIYYTTNGGSSWSAAIGLPATGWPTSAYNDTRVLCADRVAANTFYAFNKAGTYRSTDGGATWSLVNSMVKDPSYYLDILTSVPRNAGHLFLTLGFLNGSGPHPDSSRGFYRSTSGGATWSAVPNVREVWAIGFGAVASGQTYPTVWIIGWVKVGSNPYKYGVWVSKDNCTSWTWLIDYPFGSWDLPVCITGDSNDTSKCYIGYQGSGWVYGFNLSY